MTDVLDCLYLVATCLCECVCVCVSPDLRLADKYPMILLAGEVGLALHSAVIFALRLVQDDSYPFPRGKKCGPDIRHSATLPFTNHLHQRAHLHRLPSIRTHPRYHSTRQLEGGREY